MRLLLPRRDLRFQNRMARVRGHVQIEMGGEIVREMDNLFVNIGYQRIARFLGGLAPAVPNYCAVGNGDGSAGGAAVTVAAGDTTMGFELLRRQVVSRGMIGVATARFYTQFAATDVPRTLTEVGLFDAAGFSNQVSSAGSNSIADSTQNWIINQWSNWTLYIVLGTGAGQQRQILSNVFNQIIVSSNWVTLPDATSTYVIGGSGVNTYLFARAAISPSITKTLQPMNVIWSLACPQA